MKKLAALAALPLALVACSTSTHSNPAKTITVSATPSSTTEASSPSDSSSATQHSAEASSQSEASATSRSSTPDTASASTSPADAASGPTDDGASAALTPIGKSLVSPTLGSMTITKVLCGVKTVPYGGAYDANMNPTTAHAPAGKQYCAIFAHYVNTTKSPASPSEFGNLMTQNGLIFADDTETAENVSLSAPDHPVGAMSAQNINPQESVEFRAYFVLPDSEKAARVDWPGGYEEPIGAFELN